jgi:hypothetical protein
MLTKYILEIDGKDNELNSDDIKNWDEILCVYKRVDYSGVTRSFTSQFQFVNRAYELIMAAYLQDGLKTKIILKFYTVTDRWEWEKMFEFPLDISSLSWTDYVLNVNCLDDSLAASIKAHKSTKYEFVIGQDLPISNTLNYDRIAMSNMVQHVIAGDGANSLNGQYVTLHKNENKLVPIYIESDGEIYENSPIDYHNQDTGAHDSFIEVKHDVDKLEISIEINTDFTCSGFAKDEVADIYLVKTNSSGESSTIATVFHCAGDDEDAYPQSKFLGTYTSLEALKNEHPTATGGSWAIVGKKDIAVLDSVTIFAVMPFGNAANDWIISDCALWDRLWNQKDFPALYLYKNKFTFRDLKAEDKLSLVYTFQSNINVADGSPSFSVKSKIQTSWAGRAKTISIDAISPETLAKALLDKICDNKIRIKPHIVDTDVRMSKTYILAAESVRGLPVAKLYTTFNDFCNWMQAVFGYSYCLGELKRSRFIGLQTFSGTRDVTNNSLLNEMCPKANITSLSFMSTHGAFAVYNSDNGNFYTKWPATDNIDDWKEYNDETTNKARKDKVFIAETSGQGYFVNNEWELQEYEGDLAHCTRDEQDVYFMPRTSMFSDERIVEISNVRDLQYSTNNDFIFSTVIAGYDKQEYEAECGRDEWNFSAQFTTGIVLNEKKIELKSKYRADCYGLEFLSQERAKDTTDNKSDNTVFFVHCKVIETPINNEEFENGSEAAGTIKSLAIDRSVAITGALTDTVFNGEYAPYRCVKANEGYLSAIQNNCKLKFASFDGNTDIAVDGVNGNSDIQLQNQLFTVGMVEFATSDIDTPIDPTALYKVSSLGITYYGYISECKIHFARAEAIKFKLLVKDIEL